MKIAVFAAREQGLFGLRRLLIEPGVQIIALYTHRYEPHSTIERTDFGEFVAISKEHHFFFKTIDKKAEMAAVKIAEADLILSMNWRYRFSLELLTSTPLGGINIHRGALPTYAGAEPIKRALEAGEQEIVICAHQMVEQIDAGPILATASHPVLLYPNENLEAATQRIRSEIAPLFGLLCQKIYQIKSASQ